VDVADRQETVLNPFKHPPIVPAPPGGLTSSKPLTCSDCFKGLHRLPPRQILAVLLALGVMHPWVMSCCLRMGAAAHGSYYFTDEF
jgi:hypothetical protein